MASKSVRFPAKCSDTGGAFVVVQHHAPKHPSERPELLVRTTAMPVHVISDGIVVQSSRGYVMPPSLDVVLKPGRLVLPWRSAAQQIPKPADRFFEPLAEGCKEHAVGGVLSGTRVQIFGRDFEGLGTRNAELGQVNGYDLNKLLKIDGAVIALVDMHEIKRLASRELKRMAQGNPQTGEVPGA